MKDKTKKALVVGTGLLLSVALIVMIGHQFGQEPTEDVGIATENSQTTDVVVDQPNTTETEDAVTPTPIDPTALDEVESSNGVDTGTEQTLQPDPVKPEYTEEELSDPTQTPNGIPVEPPTEENPEPSTPVIESNEPTGGETSNGQIYIPGFGWIDDEGGGGTGIAVDDMYENGNKVGIMD